MKLLRLGPPGQEKPALLDAAGSARDLTPLFPDFTPAHWLPSGMAALAAIDSQRLPALPDDLRRGCPLPAQHVGKIVCVGLNYRQHALETNSAIPTEPVLFLKAVSSLTGPFDAIQIPRGSTKTDWEVELGVVIGSPAKYVDAADALKHVAGFVVVNDVSEREFQLERGGQWDKGKSCDSFSPVGPWLVSADEIGDPQNLRLWLEVNGQPVQNSSTADMIFPVAKLIAYVSQFMSLNTGDIISTGTPQGVGLGQKPAPWYLKAGDVVRLGIAGLGEQQQVCVAGG